MKVIGINTSPRKKGNTMTIVEAVLEGAKSKDAHTRLVNLNNLDINGCLGCEACKKDLGKCIQKDDLTPLLQEITDYDAIVLGTPVYWYHVSAQLKILIDRLYCFFGWDPETKQGTESAFPSGKKLVVVTSRGDAEDTEIFPEFYDYMNKWLNLVLMSLQPLSTEYIHHYGSWVEEIASKTSAGTNSELMARAKAMGASLV